MTYYLAMPALKAGASIDGVRERLAGIAGADVLFAETLKPAINGGDYIWRCVSSDPGVTAALRTLEADPALDGLDWAAFEEIGSGEKAPGRPGGVYRQLTLSVVDGTPAKTADRFARETMAMPDHISTILRWRLGQVTASGGARRWTNVWEQEFESPEGFSGEYMTHPYHWGFIDCWFDLESPTRIVDRRISNSLCRIDRPVLF